MAQTERASISISNSSTDADSSAYFSQTEVHQYIYKDGKLDKMWRIINRKDSVEVRFVLDKNGNVIEEWNVKRGTFSDPLEYYYDDKNRLTDIVRFNHKANRLLPDYMFVYDDNDRVIQKVTTTSGSKLGYLRATVEYGLRHPDLGPSFRAYLESVRER